MNPDLPDLPPDMPSETIHLEFDAGAFRDAVALVSAYSFGDAEVCEAILEGAGRDLASAFTIVAWASIGIIAQQDGRSFAEVLEACGRTAAQIAAEMAS